jgi:hypothetical protein
MEGHGWLVVEFKCRNTAGGIGWLIGIRLISIFVGIIKYNSCIIY